MSAQAAGWMVGIAVIAWRLEEYRWRRIEVLRWIGVGNLVEESRCNKRKRQRAAIRKDRSGSWMSLLGLGIFRPRHQAMELASKHKHRAQPSNAEAGATVLPRAQ
jgi:hypothetical protein